ncbi:hypothetical protein N7516_008446 [Penicillium verrucosum]|uniref:uncharacterized protein n=1 Tax=Penicillium verrucosum TaxID=60171 RepID=UPI002545A01C|nr:uncharacterized protein N7516_008446 [Penicillium verrucosum]KAJ5926673.1 hypothetical protein N7516_008446 [Penicillium verrucosum]
MEAITGADSGEAPTRDSTPSFHDEDVLALLGYNPTPTHLPVIPPNVGFPDLPSVGEPGVPQYPVVPPNVGFPDLPSVGEPGVPQYPVIPPNVGFPDLPSVGEPGVPQYPVIPPNVGFPDLPSVGEPGVPQYPVIPPNVGFPDLPSVGEPGVPQYPIPGSPRPGYYVADPTEVSSPHTDASTGTMERANTKRRRDDTNDSETPQPRKKRSAEWTSFTTLGDSSNDSRSLDADGDTPMDENYNSFNVNRKSVEPESGVWSTMRGYLGRLSRQPSPEEPDEEL